MTEALSLQAAPGGAGGHWKVNRGRTFLGWVHRIDYRHWRAKGPTGAVVGEAFPNRREAIEALDADVEAGVLADRHPAGVAAAGHPAGVGGADRAAGDDLRAGGPAGAVRPDAPAEQPGADAGARGLPYTDARMDTDPKPYARSDYDLDPEPIPNIVVHPGDTLALGAYAGDSVGVGYVRLLDRHGVCYAVLDCERDAAGHGWLVHAIRYVADRLGPEVLPVRPLPLPLPEPITVAGGNTIAVTGPLYGPYEYTLTHRHSHTHADAEPREGDLPHAHDHQHAGTAAASANAFGHATTPHTHSH